MFKGILLCSCVYKYLLCTLMIINPKPTDQNKSAKPCTALKPGSEKPSPWTPSDSSSQPPKFACKSSNLVIQGCFWTGVEMLMHLSQQGKHLRDHWVQPLADQGLDDLGGLFQSELCKSAVLKINRYHKNDDGFDTLISIIYGSRSNEKCVSWQTNSSQNVDLQWKSHFSGLLAWFIYRAHTKLKS